MIVLGKSSGARQLIYRCFLPSVLKACHRRCGAVRHGAASVALAAAFALSGCFYPHRTCSDQIVAPSLVESAVLEADKELHLSQQESLIVGRLTLMQGAKETTGEGRRIILINQENENVGVLKDAALSGSTYYLIVPPGRYYLETARPYAGFEVPSVPGVYYLGTLVVDPYKVGDVQVIDEYEAASAELRNRNPQIAIIPQRNLMRVDEAIKGVSRREENCEWDLCYAGMSVAYCPLL